MTDDRLKELGMTTPQLSKAKAIDACSVPEGIAAKTMSNLDKSDLDKLDLMDALYEFTGYKFLKAAQNNILHEKISVKRKGVRGRDDTVRVAADQQESKGALDSFKDSVSNFFKA